MMKTTLIPQKAPALLCKPVGTDYAYAVNCAYPHSFRLLSRQQYNILQAVNGLEGISAMAARLQVDETALERFLQMLGETEIIRFDHDFSEPQKPVIPKALNFWVHTTNACNLGCSYCYISTLNTGKGMTDAVRQQLLFKLLEAVQLKGIRHIKLRLAGGEPMGQFIVWCKFIPEAKQALAEAGCKFEVGFITNLTLLNEEIIAFSKAYHISYGVSLDGVEHIHDATRSFRSGCGSFGIIDANLRKLIAAGIEVSVNTVVTNLNLTGLPDLTRYLIALDIPFRYSIVKGEHIQAELLEEYLSASCAIMQDAIETGWAFSARFRFCDLKPNDQSFQTCASGFSGGAIYTDGSFKYCHVQFGDNATPTHSIFETALDLVDMINSGAYQEGAKSEDCQRCRYRSVCTSGCPVYRKDGKDPQCAIYHRFIPMYYELQAKERLHLMRQHEMI